MLSKSEGLVLHYLNYSETSIIVSVLTREAGLLSFYVPGAKKTRAKFRLAMFEPLTILDLVYYKKDSSNLQYIKELVLKEPYKTIPSDIVKTTVSLFLAEVLLAVLKQSESTPGMYDSIKNSLCLLDKTQEGVSNFHLSFLMQLTGHLGFFPRSNFDDKNCYFSLKEGFYLPREQDGRVCLDRKNSEIFWLICMTSIEESNQIKIDSSTRKFLMEKIIEYYSIHLQGIKEIRSHKVLEAVFH